MKSYKYKISWDKNLSKQFSGRETSNEHFEPGQCFPANAVKKSMARIQLNKIPW